jgi:MoaA/NifB/PqqE/SkfB family radical SAM enzyme
MTQPAIDVWYMPHQILCNFDCAYCSTAEVRGDRMWGTEDGAQVYRRIIEKIAALPHPIRLRMVTAGEPFVSKELLEGAAWLSHQPNIQFVEMLTNGSFRETQFRKFAAEAQIEKISLWITYHPTQIEAERVVAAARLASDLGAFVVVHALLFPDTVETTARVQALCREAGIRTDVTSGHNYNGAYDGHSSLPIADTDPAWMASMYRHRGALESMMVAHGNLRGAPCSAGHDYVYITPVGSVFPCYRYAQNLPRTQLGNILDDGFVLELRAKEYAPCAMETGCYCKEDYFHLKIARDQLQMSGRSLGYYDNTDDAAGRIALLEQRFRRPSVSSALPPEAIALGLLRLGRGAGELAIRCAVELPDLAYREVFDCSGAGPEKDGSGAQPACTIALSSETGEAIVGGVLTARGAFACGKLRISGDLAAAQSILERLDNSSAKTAMAGVIPSAWAR